jgi:protein disulfide-isomerase
LGYESTTGQLDRGTVIGYVEKMKRLAVILVLVFVSLTAWGDIYEWQTNLEAAKEQAAQQDKYLFLYFAGSDWCGWCQRLTEEVIETRPFREFARDNLVRVLIDFPREREISAEQEEYNRALAQEFGVEGFPTIFLLAPDGDVVLQTGYEPGGPANYVSHLRNAMTN